MGPKWRLRDRFVPEFERDNDGCTYYLMEFRFVPDPGTGDRRFRELEQRASAALTTVIQTSPELGQLRQRLGWDDE
jgi:hypothetical protein